MNQARRMCGLSSYFTFLRQRWMNRKLLDVSTATTGQVRYWLDRGASANAQSAEGYTPLMWACQSNSDTVKLLLDRGADIGLRDRHGAVAMDWAATDGRAEAIRLLLEHGADVHATA